MTRRTARTARSTDELDERRQEALARWDAARHEAEQAALAHTASREVRMDLARRLEVLREQHAAIRERVDGAAGAGAAAPGATPMARAVVVHRNAWFSSKVRDQLERDGVEVLELLENGARGVGVVVAEQPDLLLVEDTLPMLTGVEVVREVRRYAPDTLVVALVAYEDRIPAMLDAGARAAFTRRVPPLEVVQDVLVLLGEDDRVDA